MRLSKTDVDNIKSVFQDIFTNGAIYLFGSRVDDTKKGGDIDLFVESSDTTNLLEKKINFLVLLKQKIGDQKIDLIISRDRTRLIEQEALSKGIKL